MNFRLARRRSSGGFTLIELLVAIVILAILGAIALPYYFDSSYNTATQREAIARANMESSLNQLGLTTNINGFICSGDDTDGNSYVTCQVNTRDGKLLQYECPYGAGVNDNKTCKPFTQREVDND